MHPFLLSKEIFPDEWELTLRRVTLNEEYSLHCHDFFEIEIVVDGVGIQSLNGKLHELKRGSVYIMRPSDFHSVSVTEPMTIYNIMLDDVLLSNTLVYSNIGSFDELIAFFEGEELDRLISQTELLFHEHQNALEMKSAVIRNLLENIIIAVIRKNKGHSRYDKLDIPVRKALSYIQLNFKNELSLKDVAGIMNFTPAYFSDWFHKNTGKTFTEYVNSLRLSYARRLLITTDYPITEICFSSGFSSVSNFLKEFKSKYSKTPSELRKGFKG